MRDAQILILDEPTAALDAESEYTLFQRFKMTHAGRDNVVNFPPLFDSPYGGQDSRY